MSLGKRDLKKKSKTNDLIERISQSVAGLSYTSESDAPVDLFVGNTADAVTRENLLSQLEISANSPVETVAFDDFFAPLTAIQSWFGKEEKASAAKFARLRDLLKNNLEDLNVFKIGAVELDIYVVGLNAESKLMGIATKAVET